MALKKLIEIDEKFPVIKKPRLGAPPPADDVLDNVGEAEKPQKAAVLETTPMQDDGTTADAAAAAEDESATPEQTRSGAPRKRERQPKRQAHPDRSIYGRRYRKTGRTFQFGARVTPEFAEAMRVTAAARNITIGELLDEMRMMYDKIHEVAKLHNTNITDVLAGLRAADQR